MNEHRIRFEGAATAAVSVATAIADVDGVNLTSSEAPAVLEDGRVRLDFVVEGPLDVITAAVEEMRADLRGDSSIAVDTS